MSDKAGHKYRRDVSGLEFIDVYRVLTLYDVTDPCLGEAIKKLLMPGDRGDKSEAQDVAEAIVALRRWQEMLGEGTAAVADPLDRLGDTQ